MRILCLTLLLLALPATAADYWNAWTTNVPGTFVRGTNNIGITNDGGSDWRFYGTTPATVARLQDGTNIASNVRGWMTNSFGGIRLTPTSIASGYVRVGGILTNAQDTLTLMNLNGTGTLSNLAVISIPGSFLSVNGDSAEVRWEGYFATATPATNRFAMICGVSTNLDTGSQTASNGTWSAYCRVRKITTGLACVGRLSWGPGNGVPFNFTNANVSITDNNSTALTVALQCGSTVSAAIINSDFIAEYKPNSP